MLRFRPKRPPIQMVVLAACFMLAACMTTPPSSLVKLSRLSPLEADPAAIRLAVQLPDTLIVRDGDVRLRISFDGSTDTARIVEEYAAIVATDPQATPGITRRQGDGMQVVVAALSDDDAQSLAQVQQRIRLWRAAGIDGKGQLSISASACADGAQPEGPLYLTSWMQTDPGEPFFMLSRRVDLRELTARVDAPLDGVPLCEAAEPQT